MRTRLGRAGSASSLSRMEYRMSALEKFVRDCYHREAVGHVFEAAMNLLVCQRLPPPQRMLHFNAAVQDLFFGQTRNSHPVYLDDFGGATIAWMYYVFPAQ